MRKAVAALALACALSACSILTWVDDRSAQQHASGWSLDTRQKVSSGIAAATLLVTLATAGAGHDKAAHCIAGAGLAIAGDIGLQINDGWLLAVGAGVVKEGFDRIGNGDPSLEDVGATAGCGIAAGVGTSLLLTK